MKKNELVAEIAVILDANEIIEVPVSDLDVIERRQVRSYVCASEHIFITIKSSYTDNYEVYEADDRWKWNKFNRIYFSKNKNQCIEKMRKCASEIRKQEKRSKNRIKAWELSREREVYKELYKLIDIDKFGLMKESDLPYMRKDTSSVVIKIVSNELERIKGIIRKINSEISECQRNADVSLGLFDAKK